MRRARLWISAVRPAVIRCRTLNGDAMTDVQLILTALKVSIIESIIAFFIVEMPVLIQGFARNCRWWTVQLIIHIYLLYIYGRYNTRHALITKMFPLLISVSSVSGPYLKFTNITRHQMAAYTCYADNGLVPVANATFLIQVHCKYSYRR